VQQQQQQQEEEEEEEEEYHHLQLIIPRLRVQSATSRSQCMIYERKP
jgi:hypothetical protein